MVQDLALPRAVGAYALLQQVLEPVVVEMGALRPAAGL